VVCSGRDEACIGCRACYLACPNKAIEMVEDERASEVTIKVNHPTLPGGALLRVLIQLYTLTPKFLV